MIRGLLFVLSFLYIQVTATLWSPFPTNPVLPKTAKLLPNPALFPDQIIETAPNQGLHSLPWSVGPLATGQLLPRLPPPNPWIQNPLTPDPLIPRSLTPDPWIPNPLTPDTLTQRSLTSDSLIPKPLTPDPLATTPLTSDTLNSRSLIRDLWIPSQITQGSWISDLSTQNSPSTEIWTPRSLNPDVFIPRSLTPDFSTSSSSNSNLWTPRSVSPDPSSQRSLSAHFSNSHSPSPNPSTARIFSPNPPSLRPPNPVPLTRRLAPRYHAPRDTGIHAVCNMQPNQAMPHWRQPVKGRIDIIQRFHERRFLEIRVRLSGVSPSGHHGLHVHTSGDISDRCESAGGHYNPNKREHGDIQSPEYLRHAGDWGNVIADEYGNVDTTLIDRVATLDVEHSIIGRAIVLHEMPDDLGRGGDDGSRANGNAGARIACCRIERVPAWNQRVHFGPN